MGDATVNVNNKTVVHAGSGGMSTATPDTCKTPTPGGPQPMPYPNLAQSSDASQVTTSVKIDGNGVMVKDSTFAQSSGDEPGSAMGIMSNKVKGPASFTNQSTDVKFEGKAVPRLSDPMGQNEGAGNSSNATSPAEMQGPQVGTGATPGDQEACDKLADKEITNDKEGAEKAGMRQKDYKSFKTTCQKNDCSVTFRDTNPDCVPHIEAGLESKGCEWQTKTFPGKSLKEEDKRFAGLVSDNLEKKPLPPPEGALIENPGEHIAGGYPPGITGDYDMMDTLDSTGQRMAGQSEELQKSLNQGLKPLDNGMPSPERIKHGPQSAYGDYLGKNPATNPHTFPEIESPLTAFEKDGRVFRLESPEDVENYYKCKGCGKPDYTPRKPT